MVSCGAWIQRENGLTSSAQKEVSPLSEFEKAILAEKGRAEAPYYKTLRALVGSQTGVESTFGIVDEVRCTCLRLKWNASREGIGASLADVARPRFRDFLAVEAEI